MNKLYKSNKDRMLFGVAGGLAEYLNVDATIIRIIFAITTVFGGAGLWVYIILALIMPSRDNRPYNKPDRHSPSGRPMHDARPVDEDKSEKDNNWSDF